MPKDFAGVMREFKGRALHSGSSNGPVVTDPRQAKAIAISEQQKNGMGSPAPGDPMSRLKTALAGLKK